MEPILHQIYYGNLLPSEQFTVKLEEYRQLCKMHYRQYDDFFKGLDSAQQKEFNAIMEQQFDTIPMEYAEVFSVGFRMGVKVMLEVFADELSSGRVPAAPARRP